MQAHPAGANQSPKSPLIFGKYEMLRRLAVGGMGEIFLARQTGIAGFDRLVILKSLLPDLAIDPSAVEEFLDEARVAATLNHPNIIGIYEVGLWNGVYFIAMEYIDGESVGSLMHDDDGQPRRIPPEIAALIVQDAATALHHAHTASDVDGHALRIIHRDVSPQNIMVRKDGVTKVLDFGIAKAANRSTRTATGVLKGKIRYMPPEQLRGGDMDGRSDQFSLGVVFWEMVTGEKLFKNQLHLAERLMDKPVPAPSTIVDGFPPELEQVVLRMLRVEPEGRYASCHEAAMQLRRYLDACPAPVGAPELAGFVSSVAGARIAARARDVKSPQENFLISLVGGDASGSRQDDTSRSVSLKRTERRRTALLIAGIVTPLFAIGLGGVLWLEKAVEPKRAAPVLTVPAKLPTPSAPPPVQKPVAPPVLVVRSTPSGATVSVHQQVLGTTPAELTSLSAGKHALTLEKKGHRTRVVEVVLEAGARSLIDVELEQESSGNQKPPSKKPAPATKPAPPPEREPKRDEGANAPGYLSLSTTPWTRVSIDGEPRGVTPLFKEPLPAGSHVIHLSNEPEGINVTRTVVIKGGQLEKVNLNLKAP